MKNINNDKQKTIILKNGNVIEEKTVFNHTLVDYPDSNNLQQLSEKNFRLNKDSLIDNYRLN